MSTFAKVMIGVGVFAGVAGGSVLLYYALRKEPTNGVVEEDTGEDDTGEEPDVAVAALGRQPQIP